MSDTFETDVAAVLERLPDELRRRVQQDVGLLRGAGVRSTDSCIAMLADLSTPGHLRGIAAWLLGRVGGDEVVAPLLAAFDAPDPALRWEAARSLGLRRDARALAPLVQALLSTGDLDLRTAAAHALGVLGDDRAVPALLDVVSSAAEDPRLRGEAAESLAHLADRRAVAPLIGTLADESADVRFWAAFALGGLRDPRALPELERLARTDDAVVPGWWSVRAEASEAVRLIRQAIDDE